jgi:hypothetical protein
LRIFYHRQHAVGIDRALIACEDTSELAVSGQLALLSQLEMALLAGTRRSVDVAINLVAARRGGPTKARDRTSRKLQNVLVVFGQDHTVGC